MARSAKASVWVGLGAGFVLLGALTGVFTGEASDESAAAAAAARPSVGSGPGARGARSDGANGKVVGRLSADQLRAAFERAAASSRPLPNETGIGVSDLAALQKIASNDPNFAPSGAAQDASYTNLAPFRDARYYDPRDLAILAELIAANGLTEDSSANDADDGDGTLEPLELGYQVWCGGRLREFRSGPNQYASFGYGITSLPANVAKLEQLEQLDVTGNQLTELPGNLAALQNLRVLRLSDNQLQQFPDTVMRMGNLQELVLRQNRIQEVPQDIEYLRNLKELNLDGNPLVSKPDDVMQRRLDRGYDRGLAARTGAVVRSGDCQPMG